MPVVLWSSDVGQAGWIGRRLAPFDAAQVTSVVPGGFEAYARVLHAPSRDGTPVRWAQVAAWSGVPLRRDTQFSWIALPLVPPVAPVPWDTPPGDALHPADAAALVEILSARTATPRECWFCIWDGYGWESTAMLTASTEPAAPAPPVGPIDPVPPEVRAGPRVRLPNRDYLLYRGGVPAALAFLETEWQTPGLWWPQDRSWCVGTGLYTTSTYVGGPVELVRALVADARVEALEVNPADSFGQRLDGELAIRVEDAVERLLRTGSAEVATALGTVSATLRRPRWGRAGELRVSSVSWRGSGGGGWHAVSGGDAERLRQQVTSSLTWAVVGLAEG